MAFRSKQDGGRRAFKKVLDSEESRRKREEVTIELRRSKREEQVRKRRQQNQQQGAGGQTQPANQGELNQKLQQLPQLVQMVNSTDPGQQLEAVVWFRKLLSIERNPPIQRVIDSGVVPRLVECLSRSDRVDLQFEAAWALTNIASGTTDHTQEVIRHGAVNAFVQLLSSPSEDVREQAVWAMGNIAGDSTQCRDMVLQAGALRPLLNLCNEGAKITMLRNATWTLSNFCRGKPQPNFNEVSQALPTLAKLISFEDDEVLTDACWALSYLSDDTDPHNYKIQAVVQSGVVKRLVQLLMNQSAVVKTPALRTVGNIVTGDDLQTQMVLNMGALPLLLGLLCDKRKGIRKEACWTVSNITAGNVEQIQQVIDANIIPPLVEILGQSEFDIQKEAAWAISNATSGGTPQQIKYMVDRGVIRPLCELLGCREPKIIMVVLEALDNILQVGSQDVHQYNGENQFARHIEEAGGLDLIEDLQNHESEEVYKKAAKILTSGHFVLEGEEDDADAQPTLAMGQNQFAFGGQAQTPGNNGGYNF